MTTKEETTIWATIRDDVAPSERNNPEAIARAAFDAALRLADQQRNDPPRSDYERDFYLWCYVQADLLRLGRFGEADLPNIIEELETLGRSDKRGLISAYRIVLIHLLKWQFQPERRSRSWRTTLIEQRHQIETLEEESPTLAKQSDALITAAYRQARKDAAAETGLPLTTFPFECPFTPDQIRDPDFLSE